MFVLFLLYHCGNFPLIAAPLLTAPCTVQPNKLSKKMKTDAHQITTQLAQEVPGTSSPFQDKANKGLFPQYCSPL